MERIKKLQSKMREKEIEVAIICYHRDLFYYTGTAQPCNLVVFADRDPVLYVRRAFDFVKRETFLTDLCCASGLEPARQLIKEHCPSGGRLGLEMDLIPAKLYLKIKESFAGFEPVDISPLIMEQRMLKDQEETAAIREAAELYNVAHRVMMERLRPGVEEVELTAEIYRSLRCLGASCVNFHRRWDTYSSHEGILAGSRTACQISGFAMTVTGTGMGADLPWGASREKLKRGELVVLDIAINRRGYHSDISRTYAVGKADLEQKDYFAAVKAIMETTFSAAVPGITAAELYRIAADKARELEVEDYFMGYKPSKGSYIGHGIGLELDEWPLLSPQDNTVLVEGMVICIEPKLIIPRWGAVDLEETLLVTKNGPEALSTVDWRLWEVR